jgi:putative salt-induced outer membrane protein YdiY
MYTRIIPVAAAMLLLSALSPQSAFADQVRMSNGDIITGVISKIEDGKVFIKPPYAEEFSVDLPEVTSMEAEKTFEVVLEDGSEVEASFAHGENGMQTLVVDSGPIDIAMADLTLATEPEPYYERASKAEVNMTWNDGNTDSQSNLIYLDTALRMGEHRHQGDLTFRRDKTDDVYTKKQDLLRYNYNWLFANPWYLGATATYERDPIKELDHRYTVGVLMGRDIFNDDNRFLSISLGAGYTDEKFFTSQDSGATGLWALNYTQDFRGGNLGFFHNHTLNYQFFGENNAIFKSNTGFRYDIIGNVYSNVSIRYDYETEPPAGTENADTTLAIGLGASF